MQGQLRISVEEKDRMHRECLSLQKQLDYYKVCTILCDAHANGQGETESLQKKMKDADNVLSEKMALTRQVIALQVFYNKRTPLMLAGTRE